MAKATKAPEGNSLLFLFSFSPVGLTTIMVLTSFNLFIGLMCKQLVSRKRKQILSDEKLSEEARALIPLPLTYSALGKFLEVRTVPNEGPTPATVGLSERGQAQAEPLAGKEPLAPATYRVAAKESFEPLEGCEPSDNPVRDDGIY